VFTEPASGWANGLTLSGLRVSPRRHSVARRKLTISYKLLAASTVAITLKRETPGRKAGGRCVKQTRHNRGHKKCTRLVGVSGQIVKDGAAGANSFRWNGKIGGHKLRPGTYQLTATAGGKPRTTRFTIVG
jgi:hypothetical protein